MSIAAEEEEEEEDEDEDEEEEEEEDDRALMQQPSPSQSPSLSGRDKSSHHHSSKKAKLATASSHGEGKKRKVRPGWTFGLYSDLGRGGSCKQSMLIMRTFISVASTVKCRSQSCGTIKMCRLSNLEIEKVDPRDQNNTVRCEIYTLLYWETVTMIINFSRDDHTNIMLGTRDVHWVSQTVGSRR